MCLYRYINDWRIYKSTYMCLYIYASRPGILPPGLQPLRPWRSSTQSLSLNRAARFACCLSRCRFFYSPVYIINDWRGISTRFFRRARSSSMTVHISFVYIRVRQYIDKWIRMHVHIYKYRYYWRGCGASARFLRRTRWSRIAAFISGSGGSVSICRSIYLSIQLYLYLYDEEGLAALRNALNSYLVHYIYIYRYIYIYMYLYIYICTYICLYLFIFLQILCTYVLFCICTYMLYTYIWIFIHTQIYQYIHVRSFFKASSNTHRHTRTHTLPIQLYKQV